MLILQWYFRLSWYNKITKHMELKQIYYTLKNYKLVLLAAFIFGAAAGFAAFNFPRKHIATGSFYINRSVEFGNTRYFTYEGYYGQQNALAYANTVTALLESADLKSKSLQKLNISPNENNLRKLSRSISIKKTGPQLIVLAVKGNDAKSAVDTWNSLASTLLDTNKTINDNGDPFINISKISDSPVIQTEYRPLWLCISMGILFFDTLVIIYISLREYFKD